MIILMAAATAVASPLDQAFDYAPRLFRARERDQFADIKPPPVDGKQFTVTARFTAGDGYDTGPAFYAYKDGILTLTMSGGAYPDPEIDLRSADSHDKSYVGRNAFGTRVRVSVTDRYIEALLAETAPPASPYYEATLEAPPSAAKAIATGGKVIISGTIGGEKGALTECHDTHSSATIDDPDDLTVRTCSVRVHIQRIAFVKRDGSIIKEWTLK